MGTFRKTIFFLLASVLLAGCDKPKVEADYSVIPLPQEIMKSGEELFTLNGNTKIVYPKGNDVQKQTAEFLHEYIKLSTGLKLKVTDQETADNAIVLKADYKGERAESYNLTVDAKLITINGTDEAGTFYGVQTLRKSIPADGKGNTIVFPAVDIKDYPRFEYRGMMLDVGRHFFPVEFIKKYIDILALHNVNRFHWHLTEDQGWRIEIKKYPELTKTGSIRAQTVVGRNNSGVFDGKPYGGFYTQEEVKDIVAYAQKRFITVVPEVDLPGHMLAALATYPNLGCTGGPYKVGEQWGVFEDVLCAGNNSVYTFLEDVYSEIIELFPSKYIHIGGDECPKTRWKACPKCQAKIKAEGLKADANHSAEDRLQSYVISRIEKFLNSKGRQIIGWDEILEGGLAPNATVMSWRSMEGGVAAAKQKHNAIMTPNSHLYFDAYQTLDIDGEPLAIGGYTPVEKVYAFEPVSPELSADERKYIIGTQANLWTEYIGGSKQVEYMVLPRMAALAEVQWSEPAKKDFATFLPRLNRLLGIYDLLGYNYAKHIFEISAKVEPDWDKGVVTVSLATADNAPIYYTLGDATPNETGSTKYTQPIEIKGNAVLKAAAVRNGEAGKPYTESFSFNKATLKRITLETEPHPQYTFKGAVTLVDAKRGRSSFGGGEWLGFSKTGMVAIVDLKELTEVSSVSVGTLINVGSWIFGAREFTVLVSDDNKSFKQVANEVYPPLAKGEDKIVDLTAKFTPVKTRYVKIVVKNEQSIPDWHQGKGNNAFVFIDEIVIN